MARLRRPGGVLLLTSLSLAIGMLFVLSILMFMQLASRSCMINKKRARDLSTIQGDLGHVWIHGETGCGKSRFAWDSNPDAYIKDLTLFGGTGTMVRM